MKFSLRYWRWTAARLGDMQERRIGREIQLESWLFSRGGVILGLCVCVPASHGPCFLWSWHVQDVPKTLNEAMIMDRNMVIFSSGANFS
jgi:hypothetical protein